MFIHLHLHTEYSLLDGAVRVRDLAARAAELGFSSCAITDHGVMYGAVAFCKAMKEAGIRPIVGCEVYVAARSRRNMEYPQDAERFHLVLLCKNEEGYHNLCRLVSLSFTQGFYIKPRVDMEILREYSEGLIALSACLSGKIPRLISEDNYIGAKNYALEMREIFGEDGFWLELQDHGLREQPKVNAGILRIHEETGIGLVVTNDVHYLNKEDAETQDVLLTMQTQKTIDDPDRMRMGADQFYFKSEDEMRQLFPAYPEAYDNTQKIADMCDFEFEFGKYFLPEFILPEGETDAAAYLRRLCEQGISRRYGEDCAHPLDQLYYELDMISRMGFTDYFLIVWDFIRYAKENGIPVGPGRGSGAGSIAAYALDITTVDPLKYNLYFERFLNPERISMPDFDIDFCERRRAEVLDYVKNKYGEDHVAQIATFGTLKAKAAVRNVAKALGFTFTEESALANMVTGFQTKLTDALKNPKLREAYDGDPRIKQVIDFALKLEDMPKDSGTHAAGVVITKKPVMEYVPLALSKKDDSIATQYNKDEIEQLGLLKMDFLALRNLTVIDDAVIEIRKTNPEFSLETIPDDDAPTYEMLSQGKTSGVFQLESEGMTGVATGLCPRSIEDITAIIALYRPGPMDSIPRFLECAKNPGKVKYAHPTLEPILSVTYGCIVYQEQVIEIFRKLGGFTLGQADMIRRAMSKKKMKDIEHEKESFINGDTERGIPGAVKNGIPAEAAAGIYDEILDFANYAFNKAHAVCYAVVSYQTAYLKRHFPREYMAALLTSMLSSPEKVAEYAAECREMGISLLKPDINRSVADFSADGSDIRYGLAAAKGVGHGFVNALVRDRTENGPFTGLDNFISRCAGSEVNKRGIESLILCGAFDGLGAKRSQMMAALEKMLRDFSEDRKRNMEGQLDLFSGEFGSELGISSEKFTYPDMAEYTPAEMSEHERAVTGLYLSGHPADAYREYARRRKAVTAATLISDGAQDDDKRDYADGMEVAIVGAVSGFKTKLTKNNTRMAYLSLDDGTGEIESLVFERVLRTTENYMTPGNVLYLRGKLSTRDDKPPQILADTVEPVSTDAAAHELPAQTPAIQKALCLTVPSESSESWRHMIKVFPFFPGKDPVIVKFTDTGKKAKSEALLHPALIAEAEETLGPASVKYS